MSNVTNLGAPPSPLLADSTAPLESEQNGSHRHPSAAKARCAVAEYLRDLGLRDPDVIAKESQRIVAQALQQSPAADEAGLCEAAIWLTVKQLERWLVALAAQSGSPEEPQRLGSVIAARLPDLLDQFPQALSEDRSPSEVAGTLQASLPPVVPQSLRRRMRRQALALVPTSLKRFSSRARSFVFGRPLE